MRGRRRTRAAAAPTRRAAPGQPINQSMRLEADYGKDPRGQRYSDALIIQGQHAIDGSDGLVYTGDQGAPERSFNGDLGASPQLFTGAAALALYGAARPIVNGGSATFDTARSIDGLNDLPLRIFAARAARKAGA